MTERAAVYLDGVNVSECRRIRDPGWRAEKEGVERAVNRGIRAGPERQTDDNYGRQPFRA